MSQPKFDRFDLEQQIFNCWNVVEDLKTLYEHTDYQQHMTQDEMQNALLGLHQVYNLKFQKLFSMFETMVTEQKVT